jgi:hypothetical protein
MKNLTRKDVEQIVEKALQDHCKEAHDTVRIYIREINDLTFKSFVSKRITTGIELYKLYKCAYPEGKLILVRPNRMPDMFILIKKTDEIIELENGDVIHEGI